VNPEAERQVSIGPLWGVFPPDRYTRPESIWWTRLFGHR